ncbi:hypothetical protein D3C78_1298890 [compost metagenome]
MRPAIIPDITFPIIVSTTAPIAAHAALPSVSGSMLRPKLKKNTAPKKSRKGTTRCSILLLCSVSDKASPNSRAPIASATCSVSEKPAMKNNAENTTIIKISFDEIFSSLFSMRVPFLAMTKNSSIYPIEIPTDMNIPPIEVAPPSSIPDITDKNTARKISSNKIMPRMSSVSELPVRLSSTKVLATIAVEDTDIIPAIISVSYKAKPAAKP